MVAINHADEPDKVPLTADILAPKAELVWGSAKQDAKNTLQLPPRSIGIWKDPR